MKPSHKHWLALCVAGVVSLVALLLLARPQHARPTQSATTAIAHPPGPRLHLKGVPNFGEVTPQLYRGGQPTAEGFANLKSLGIDIVVDLREGNRGAERAAVTKQGMQYMPIPWNCNHPNDALVAQFLELLRHNPAKKVFVHCRHGVDRTGLMVAAYRIGEQGWTARDARREMNAYGYNFVHRTWCHTLAGYEKNFPHQFAADPTFQPLRPVSPAPPHN